MYQTAVSNTGFPTWVGYVLAAVLNTARVFITGVRSPAGLRHGALLGDNLRFDRPAIVDRVDEVTGGSAPASVRIAGHHRTVGESTPRWWPALRMNGPPTDFVDSGGFAVTIPIDAVPVRRVGPSVDSVCFGSRRAGCLATVA